MPLSAKLIRRRRVRARTVGLPTRLLASLLDALLPTAGVILLLRLGVTTWRVASRYPELLGIDAALRVFFEEPRLILGVPFTWMLLWTALTLAQLGIFRTTLGKAVLGLDLRQRDGSPASALRLLARVATSWLVPASLGLAYIWIAINPERRGLHDVASGTFVVRVEPQRRMKNDE